MNVEKIILHPDYSNTDGLLNDVALLKLEKEVSILVVFKVKNIEYIFFVVVVLSFFGCILVYGFTQLKKENGRVPLNSIETDLYIF